MRGDEINVLDKTDGYAILNLRSEYRIGTQVTVFARIENAFDEKYETFGSLGEPDEIFAGFEDPRFFRRGPAVWRLGRCQDQAVANESAGMSHLTGLRTVIVHAVLLASSHPPTNAAKTRLSDAVPRSNVAGSRRLGTLGVGLPFTEGVSRSRTPELSGGDTLRRRASAFRVTLDELETFGLWQASEELRERVSCEPKRRVEFRELQRPVHGPRVTYRPRGQLVSLTLQIGNLRHASTKCLQL